MRYIKNGMVIEVFNPDLIELYDASDAYERIDDAPAEQEPEKPAKRARKK